VQPVQICSDVAEPCPCRGDRRLRCGIPDAAERGWQSAGLLAVPRRQLVGDDRDVLVDAGERCQRTIDVAALDDTGSQPERASIGLPRQQLRDPAQAVCDRRRVLPLRFDRSAQRLQLGMQPGTERGHLVRQIEIR
jgi:hypothetical protein